MRAVRYSRSSFLDSPSWCTTACRVWNPFRICVISLFGDVLRWPATCVKTAQAFSVTPRSIRPLGGVAECPPDFFFADFFGTVRLRDSSEHQMISEKEIRHNI